MKLFNHIVTITVIIFLSQCNLFSQTGRLKKRIISDTTIMLIYADSPYANTLELNRSNKTICEVNYTETGKKYTEINYNAYHSEVGLYKLYDSLGNLVYMADNNLGKVYTFTSNGLITVINKPKIFLDDEAQLIKKYGRKFVKKHFLYFPNNYYGFGFLDTISQDLMINKPDKSEYYFKGFKFMLSDGNIINRFCVPYFYNAVTKKDSIISCTNTIDFTNYIFCDSVNYYYNEAKQFGLLKSRDYVVQNFEPILCEGQMKKIYSGVIMLNLIEILKIDTIANKQKVIYNIYSFNPWTREFIKKTKTESGVDDFLLRVINFENEIYIHRFKDPLISRPKYLDDIINFFQIDKYKYIIDE